MLLDWPRLAVVSYPWLESLNETMRPLDRLEGFDEGHIEVSQAQTGG